MPARPRVVDLFAGAGGFSLGFEQAGFDVTCAVELDPAHAAAHAFNFPACRTFARSVADVRGADLFPDGIPRDAPLVVIGGPPCQGFSMIGKRVLDDSRNRLVGEYVRIVAELEADYFVVENVKGITLGDHSQILHELAAEFDACGYAMRKPWRVLNAVHYGVPQSRERLFLVGARKGLVLPEYPRAMTEHPTDVSIRHLPRAPTVRDALGDLPDPELFDELREGGSVRAPPPADLSPYASEMRCTSTDGWHFGWRRVWDSGVLTCSSCTDHTETSRRRFALTAPGETEPRSRLYRLHPDGVCPTLRAGTDSSRGAHTSPRPIHPEHPRCVTVREMARLHGYPDWFRFHATKWHGARQVGNSVPPPLARSVAFKVLEAASLVPTRPAGDMALGDSALLAMSVEEAAVYWGVPNPIERRTHLGMAKKRKQSETEDPERPAVAELPFFGEDT